MNKHDYLSCIVASCSADIIALNEAGLKNDARDADILVGASDCNVYRLDNVSYRLLLSGTNWRRLVFLLNATLNKFGYH